MPILEDRFWDSVAIGGETVGELAKQVAEVSRIRFTGVEFSGREPRCVYECKFVQRFREGVFGGDAIVMQRV